MADLIIKKLKGQPTQQIDAAKRTRVWVLTTGTIDEDGETVDPLGGEYTDFYRRGSPIQWNHDTDKQSIGAIVGPLWNAYVGEGTEFPEVIGPKRMAVLGRVYVSDKTQQAREVWDGINENPPTVKNGSISFVPTSKPERNAEGGNHYPKWRLLEFTLCAIGSNPDAVATLKKCLNCATKKSCECNKPKTHRLVLRKNMDKMYEGSKPYKEGWAAADQGQQSSANPYTGTAGKAWLEGWTVASGTKSYSLTGVTMKKRKAWRLGKSLWLLKSEGRVAKNGMGLDEEMKDYLQMRGLDEVKVADGPPPDDMGYAPVEEAEAPPMGDPMGDPVQMDVGGSTGSMGAMPPGGKAEEIADDVAMRAADLTGTGMANEPAVDMAMEEEGLPKSVRPAVKHLALKKLAKAMDDEDTKSKADDDDKDKKKSVAPGKLARTKSGNLVLVRTINGKVAKIAKISGDEVEEKVKNLKVVKKSGEWGLPSKITAWGDMQAKLTNWYGTFAGTVKSLPALKDADLTGEEQKGVEDAVDEAFMKAAEDLDLKGFLAQPAVAQKTSDSIVPQDDLANTNSPDMSLAIASNGSAEGPGNDLSTVPQGKLPNSNPGKAFPRKELKAYAKHIAAKVAESHGPKLRKTIEKRATKFIVKYVTKAAPEDMSPATACTKLKDDNGELTSVERGMLGAACARGSKKLSKRFTPENCGKKKCRKGWLCKKCCKKVLAKAGDMMTNAPNVDLPPQLGTTMGVQVRATPDGQFETWNTSTGQSVDGPFPSMDAAGEALSKHLRKVMDDEEKRKSPTSGGTMDPSTKPADNIEGSPTGGGTMELKADDDDDAVQKRGRALLTKGDDDEDLKALQKQLEEADKAINGFAKKVYATTALKA